MHLLRAAYQARPPSTRSAIFQFTAMRPSCASSAPVPESSDQAGTTDRQRSSSSPPDCLLCQDRSSIGFGTFYLKDLPVGIARIDLDQALPRLISAKARPGNLLLAPEPSSRGRPNPERSRLHRECLRGRHAPLLRHRDAPSRRSRELKGRRSAPLLVGDRGRQRYPEVGIAAPAVPKIP